MDYAKAEPSPSRCERSTAYDLAIELDDTVLFQLAVRVGRTGLEEIFVCGRFCCGF